MIKKLLNLIKLESEKLLDLIKLESDNGMNRREKIDG